MALASAHCHCARVLTVDEHQPQGSPSLLGDDQISGVPSQTRRAHRSGGRFTARQQLRADADHLRDFDVLSLIPQTRLIRRISIAYEPVDTWVVVELENVDNFLCSSNESHRGDCDLRPRRRRALEYAVRGETLGGSDQCFAMTTGITTGRVAHLRLLR